MYYIYEIKNLINGKTYIGQRRCPEDKTPEIDDYMGSGELVIKAIKKYGLENFIKSILEDKIETKKELDERERYWIKKYKEEGKAEYNISTGGTGGNLGEEVNLIIGKTSKEHWDNKEFREKLIKAHLGKSPGNKGTHMTEEQKKRVSLGRSGIKPSKEWCEKMSKIMKEKWASGEYDGRKTNKGIPHSEETRHKISESHKGIFKGLSWKVIDGKRVWFRKGEIANA